MTDGPDFPADQKVAFLVFDDGKFARAARKAVTYSFLTILAAGKFWASKVRLV